MLQEAYGDGWRTPNERPSAAADAEPGPPWGCPALPCLKSTAHSSRDGHPAPRICVRRGLPARCSRLPLSRRDITPHSANRGRRVPVSAGKRPPGATRHQTPHRSPHRQRPNRPKPMGALAACRSTPRTGQTTRVRPRGHGLFRPAPEFPVPQAGGCCAPSFPSYRPSPPEKQRQPAREPCFS